MPCDLMGRKMLGSPWAHTGSLLSAPILLIRSYKIYKYPSFQGVDFCPSALLSNDLPHGIFRPNGGPWLRPRLELFRCDGCRKAVSDHFAPFDAFFGSLWLGKICLGGLGRFAYLLPVALDSGTHSTSSMYLVCFSACQHAQSRYNMAAPP